MAARFGKAGAPRAGMGSLSCLFVGEKLLAACFLCAVAANRFGFSLLAAFSLLLGLLGLSARLWGALALRGVVVEADADRTVLSAGERFTLRCRVRNQKLLPLLWLEFCLPVPPRDCLEPDDCFVRCADPPDGEEEPPPVLYRRRLSLLLWYRTAEWESVWTARRRGVYRPEAVLLRGGDGFGLTQSQRLLPLPGPQIYAVYPRLVPVRADDLLKTHWMGQTGDRGNWEDPTVLRGERDYRPGDPWKRIDWRMAARQDPLQVKLYDTVLPKQIHFIVDLASFSDSPPENEELEEALSVLASLLLSLDKAGVRCGLSLPRTGSAPSMDLFPAAARTEDLLFQLAALEVEGAAEWFSDQAAALRQQGGQLCLLTRGGGRVTCRALLEQLDLRTLTVLAMLPPGGAELWANCRVLRINSLKTEGTQ